MSLLSAEGSVVSAAIDLVLKGHSITVLERTLTLQSIGGGILIPPQSCKVIDSWGCFDRFLKVDAIRDKLVIYRYTDGSLIGSNDFGWQKHVYGYPYVALSFICAAIRYSRRQHAQHSERGLSEAIV
jgi:2-polyprenyl-6-methoxyphenol hydroxylase-like FAD-dependent oxidoreductase